MKRELSVRRGLKTNIAAESRSYGSEEFCGTAAIK